MNAKIRVTFDMCFVTPEGECKTTVSFKLVDYPGIPCPEKIKGLVIQEIRMLCGAMGTVSEELFSEKDT